MLKSSLTAKRTLIAVQVQPQRQGIFLAQLRLGRGDQDYPAVRLPEGATAGRHLGVEEGAQELVPGPVHPVEDLVRQVDLALEAGLVRLGLVPVVDLSCAPFRR